MAGDTSFEAMTRERLDRLEKENRRWRGGAIVGLALAAVVIAAAMAEPPAKELSVQTLRIVDREGKNRIVLSSDPKSADLTFLDLAGKSRLVLDLTQDREPELLFSEKGKEGGRLALGLNDGLPMLQFYDDSGKKRVTIGVPKGNGAVIRILDENERLKMRFP